MKISDRKKVTLSYDLHLDGFDGEIADSANEKEPFVFVCGEGETLEPFEENLMGLQVGDEFRFEIKAEDAYGEEDPESILEIPKTNFEKEELENMEIGDVVPMEDEDETVFDSTVVDITDDFVILDFNHPLAGEDLYFVGKILKVEENK